MRILLIGHGYIGTYLADHLVRRGHDLTICARRIQAHTRAARVIEKPYQDLDQAVLNEQDAILWFAGHSSVQKSMADPEGAVQNNCFDLLKFARRRPVKVPFIYASTASLYSVPSVAGAVPPELKEGEAVIASLNAYDSSKAAFDALVGTFCTNTMGLRLGTVCGMSPALRPELIFNAMNISALRDGAVTVTNTQAWRSLLFLEDLALAIDGLLQANSLPGQFVNLASYNIQIGEIASQIARYHSVPLYQGGDSATYSFRMNTDLAQSTLGPFAGRSLAEQCAAFCAAVQGTAS